jgi:hypothetical protein
VDGGCAVHKGKSTTENSGVNRLFSEIIGSDKKKKRTPDFSKVRH